MRKFLYGVLLGSLLLLGSFATPAKAEETANAIICKEKIDADIIAQAMYNFVNSLDTKEIHLILSMKSENLCWGDEITVPPSYIALTRVPDDSDSDVVYVVIKLQGEATPTFAVIFKTSIDVDA